MSDTTTTAPAPAGNAGIECTKDTLVNGQCKFDIYKTLNITNKYSTNSEKSTVFIKDMFTGATFFIGTVVTISLVISGFMYILAGGDSSMADKGKKGIMYSIIGLLLVIFSYTIIRVVQYMAQ